MIDEKLYSVAKLEKKCIVLASLKELPSQRGIINNNFDYGDEVACYVTCKEGNKISININLISLAITQVIIKRNKYQRLDMQI